MHRLTLPLLSLAALLAACGEPPESTLTTFNTTTETGDGDGDPGDGDGTPGDGDGDGDGDGEPTPDSFLRYVMTEDGGATITYVDLDDPHAIPAPGTVLDTDGYATMRGRTPWDTLIIAHDDVIEQLRLKPDGAFSLSPFVDQPASFVGPTYFGDDPLAQDGGQNGLLVGGLNEAAGPHTLIWGRWHGDGELFASFDITPPIEQTGVVLALGRSPDGRFTAVLVDAEPNSYWHLYILPVDPEPGLADYLDQINLVGLPALSVADFIWFHIDNQRVSYRKEMEPNVRRPVAVDFANPDLGPIPLSQTLGHTYSMVWDHTDTRVLVATDAGQGFRDLTMLELNGPTSVTFELPITEPGEPAVPSIAYRDGDLITVGHGFDGQGRIYYAFADANIPTPKAAGIKMVTVGGGSVLDRVEVARVPASTELDEIAFDPATQLLGYRFHTVDQAWVAYIDMSVVEPEPIRIEAIFDHNELDPGNNARFGWSPDKLTVAINGFQGGMPLMHVHAVGDGAGTTSTVALPDALIAMGVDMIGRPLLSPNGDQVLQWYGTANSGTGLIQAPTDGANPGQVLLGLSHSITAGAFMQLTP